MFLQVPEQQQGLPSTLDLKSLYKIRLNLQCPSTLEGGEGAAEEEEGSKSSPCLNVYPTFLSPLIFGIGSLNTKWGILHHSLSMQSRTPSQTQTGKSQQEKWLQKNISELYFD